MSIIRSISNQFGSVKQGFDEYFCVVGRQEWYQGAFIAFSICQSSEAYKFLTAYFSAERISNTFANLFSCSSKMAKVLDFSLQWVFIVPWQTSSRSRSLSTQAKYIWILLFKFCSYASDKASSGTQMSPELLITWVDRYFTYFQSWHTCIFSNTSYRCFFFIRSWISAFQGDLGPSFCSSNCFNRLFSEFRQLFRCQDLRDCLHTGFISISLASSPLNPLHKPSWSKSVRYFSPRLPALLSNYYIILFNRSSAYS